MGYYIKPYTTPSQLKSKLSLKECFTNKISNQRISSYFDYFKVKSKEQIKTVEDLRIRGYSVQFSNPKVSKVKPESQSLLELKLLINKIMEV